MSPGRHLLTAGVVWVVLSVVGIAIVAGWQILPAIASREADIENNAFVVLTMASVPVLMFVVVGLVYSALRFRANGEIDDGPPIHGHTGFQAVWVATSFVLVLGLFAFGAIGLVEIRGAQSADFEVHVIGEQWNWKFEYPGTGVQSTELHVPVDRRVHLEITSMDVIHAFWVPAFGIKQDAVPGHPTHAYVTPTRTGTFPGMCAELCGLGHTSMLTMVVVSDQAGVEAWLREQPGETP